MNRINLAMLLATVGAVACNQPAADTALDLEVREQRASYAQGVMIGQQGQEFPVQVDAFVQGVRDGIEGNSQLNEAELAAAVSEFHSIRSEGADTEAAENKLVGEEFLAENAQREGVIVTESGLQYEVLVAGDGPRPTETDTVTVHYRGTTLDGTEFDGSRSHDPPGPSTFGVNRVIAGWTEGLQLMPVGSKYKLYIRSDLAYGDNAPPGAGFGPGSTLVFEVELLGIVGKQ